MPIFQAKTQNASGPTTNELSSRISCICSPVSTSCAGWLPAHRCSWSCARPPLLSSVPVVWLVVLRGVLRTSVPGGDDWQLIRLYLTVHCIDVARLGGRITTAHMSQRWRHGQSAPTRLRGARCVLDGATIRGCRGEQQNGQQAAWVMTCETGGRKNRKNRKSCCSGTAIFG